MSQFPCNVYTYESLDAYNATLWAIQNPWFRNCSSLAGALGEQEDQGASFEHPLAVLDFPEWHQEHGIALAPLDSCEGYPEHWGTEEVEPESVPGPTTSNAIFGNHSSGSGTPLTIADLKGKVARFCLIGKCLYWHTDHRQVKRHRDSHFKGRYRWPCPNEMDTCPGSRRGYRRSDAVIDHCKKFPACLEKLEAIGRKPWREGERANERDLKSYDPMFHIPYEEFDGRRTRG